MQQMPLDYAPKPLRAEKEKKKGTEVGNIRLQALWQYLPGAMYTFLLSQANCFSISASFPLCFLMAHKAWTGKTPMGAGFGMALACVMRLIWGIDSQWLQMIVFFAAAFLIQKPIPDKRKVYGLLLTGSALGALPGIWGQDALAAIGSVAGIALGMGCMPAMLRTVQLENEKKQERTEDDFLCMVLPAMLLLCGACRMQIGSINLGLAAAFFLVVSIGWACGAMAGAAAGIAAGFASLMGNMHALYMIVMPFAGLLCGCFRRKNRLLCAAVYVFSSVCIAYAAMKMLPVPLMWNVCTAVLCLILVPEKRLRRQFDLIGRMQWARPRENAYLRMRMQRWVRAIDHLTDALPKAQRMEEDIAVLGEAIAEEVCENCDQLPICWWEKFEETKRSMEALAECDETDLEMINRHFSHCQRIAKLPAAMEKQIEKRQREYKRVCMAEYERSMLETHLMALSQAAQMISLEGMNTKDEEKEWQTAAEEALQKMRFSGNVAFVKRVDGHLTVGVQCDMIALHPVMGERLAEQLGVYLGVKLQVTEQNATQVVLEEKAPLSILCGSATACAVGGDMEKIRPEQKENGDALKIRILPGGQALLALSDGMGHGMQAKKESQNTLEMLCSCLEAGYDSMQAMKAVNGAMLNATGGEIYATVDLCLLDLWTGRADFHKLGASGSVIIQGQRAQWITGAALPLGIMEHVLPTQKQMMLAEGDRLILISDGIFDAFDQEEALLHAIERHYEEMPREMAESLLEEAVSREGGLPRDDMTVLCVQLIQTFPENKRRAGA